MKIKKDFKKLVGGVLVLIFLFSLFSLSTVSFSKEKITISMWTHDNLYVEFFTRRGKEWATKHPEYKFKFDFVRIPYEQLWPKVLTTLAAGAGAPDLVGIEISAFSRFMKHNIAETALVDLTPLIGEEKDKFLRWEPYTFKGKIYGVESAFCPVVYYYRKDIFDNAGIKTPIESWDDFVRVGQKLSAQGKYMAAVATNDVTHFMELFMQQEGLLFDEEGNLCLDDPRAVKALRLLVDGVEKKILWPTTDFYGAPHFAALKENKVVGDFMPDWWSVYLLKPNVPEQKGLWKIQLLPAWEKGGKRTSTWGGTGFAITKQSKHVDLVWDFLHYAYMTKENQVKRFLEIQYFPTMIEAIKDPRVINYSDPYYGNQKIGAVFAEAALQKPIQWQSPYWSETLNILNRETITPALTGKKNPKQAIEDAVNKIEVLMRKGF